MDVRLFQVINKDAQNGGSLKIELNVQKRKRFEGDRCGKGVNFGEHVKGAASHHDAGKNMSEPYKDRKSDARRNSKGNSTPSNASRKSNNIKRIATPIAPRETVQRETRVTAMAGFD
ncbi:hypothetical protein SUGI_0660400 [Cryptomeria japonica]|nr:hypothetical protein SUGI_0660400 [Cryptomeria japonica]